MEKFGHATRGHTTVIGVKMKTGLTILNNFQRAAVTGNKGRQSRNHGLDNRQTKGLKQGRLDKSSTMIGYVAIQLSRQRFVKMLAEPTHLVIKAVLIKQLMHPFDLPLLFLIGGTSRIGVAGDNQQVGGRA